ADAEDLIERLWADYPGSDDVKSALVGLRVGRAEKALKDGQPEEARRLLDRLDQQIPNSPAAVPLRKELEAKARSLLREAEAESKKDPSRARNLLRAIQAINPRDRDAQELDAKLSNSYQVLRVGVRDLPRNLSPARAVLPEERQALPLLFESLI